ncbi:MAG: hypothetical protein LRY55_14450 [Leadbetterella sp.]|nr:hypothetical protein [Leadbetterella sp.]
MAYPDDSESYATRNDYLKEMGSSKEYTREMGRVGGMLADYERIYMEFKYLKVKKPAGASQVSPARWRSAARVRCSSMS